MTSTVLVVDDQPNARRTVAALLHTEAYEIAFAKDGSEALAFVEAHNPDLVLLDVMMPGMDGFEVCRRIKTDYCERGIPVVLFTALDDKAHVVKGLNAGADEFLSKPVSGPVLRARVRSMLRIKHQHDELRARLTAREEVTRMVVHDMRSPLTTILAGAECLQMSEEFDAECVEDILIASKRLNDFANDMLLAAKMEQGAISLNLDSVEVCSLVHSVSQGFRLLSEQRGVRVCMAELPSVGTSIYGDVKLLHRVLENLISNAMRFAPRGTDVSVSALQQTGLIEFRVADLGPGVPNHEKARVFEKFAVVEGTSESKLGLGLSFCRQVVEAHSGTIRVEDNLPAGSVFVVSLPAHAVVSSRPISSAG